MKIALIGGTHGNEPIGLEVMRLFSQSTKKYKNSFSCFWGNPKAYELKKRYVDFDLNRAFGPNNSGLGYEKKRAEELKKEIFSHYDFSIDLHTTTSNMGETVILNNTNPITQQVAASLLKQRPGLRLIEEMKLDEKSNHLNRLCPAGLTVELGPVANNVINAELLIKMYKIVELILNFDFATSLNLQEVEYYKMTGVIHYPDEEGWYLHPKVDCHDFKVLNPGDPIFITIDGRLKNYLGRTPTHPFFVNEAAYLENRSAFLLSDKKKGF